MDLPKLRAVLLVLTVVSGCSAAEVKRPGGAGPASGGNGNGSTPPGGVSPGATPPGAPPVTLPDAGPAPAPTAPPTDRQCAGEIHSAEIVPLDLLLMVDASGSMDQSAGTQSKWETARTALGTFIRDPASAGLGVGLQFFPSDVTCTRDSDCFPGAPSTSILCPPGPAPRTCRLIFPGVECAPANYDQPAVAIAALPMAQMPLLAALTAKEPTGGTPMGPAVRGALAHLRTHLMANPGRKAALVLASDGIPGEGCAMNDIPTIAGNIAAARTGTPAIPTYVIGVFSPGELMMSQQQLDQLAMSGGTGNAFVLAATNDLNQRLLAALNQIRGAALACEYQIPPASGGRIDFAKVNVRYTGGGVSENVPYIESADRCDPMRGGWYYDVPPSMGQPTRILTCEATCRRLRTDTAGKVELVFGCATQVID